MGDCIKMEIDVKKVLEEYKTQQHCDPCRFTGRQIVAKSYCKTCEGLLCPDCAKAHKRAKETKLHVITSAHKMADKGGKSALRSLEHCEKHKSVLESFCEEHDALCCRECVAKDHVVCRKLVPLQRASAGIHENRKLKEVSDDLDHLLANFERRVRDEQEAVRRVDAKGRVMEDAVKTFRTQINKLIDRIEMSMHLKRDEVTADEKAILKDRVDLCQKAIPNLRRAEDILGKINSKTEDQLAFIAMKNVKHMIEKYNRVNDELLDTQGTFSLKFIPNKDLAAALDSFGSINVKSTLRPVGSAGEGGESEEEKLVLAQEVDVRAPTDGTSSTITGCTFMPDGRLVVADEGNQSIKLFDSSLKFVTSYKTSAAPWDIAAISDTQIAVRNSFSDTDENVNKVLIVEIKNNVLTHKREFMIDGRPRAIRYCSPYLYIACSEGKKAHVLVVDKEDKVVRTIRPKAGVLSQPQYMSVSSSADLVWISDFYNGIIALNMKGGVVFRLTDSHVTEYGGITIDVYDDVYICAGKPYGVYKVTREGKELKSLIEWEQGTLDPQAVAYNSAEEYFLITGCNSDKAFVYKYAK